MTGKRDPRKAMSQTDRCPKCRADLSYEDHGRQYSRIVGIELGHDRIESWRCPDCGYETPDRREFQRDSD